MVFARLIRCFVVVGVFMVAAWPSAALAQLVEPVDGEVVDRFRPPAHIGAPGNRGWEYRTEDGSPVVAASSGVVVFAGQIGGSLYVSIQHPGGLRTTYSHLAEVSVARGDAVAAGARLGTTGSVFHFGARRDGAYVDPAGLFATLPARMRVRLVSANMLPRQGGSHAAMEAVESGALVQLSDVPQYTRRSAHQRVE